MNTIKSYLQSCCCYFCMGAKCFGNFTDDELRAIYYMNIRELLNNDRYSNDLKDFLQQVYKGERTRIIQYLEIYQQCNNYLKAKTFSFKIHDLDYLIRLGLPYIWEQDLRFQLASYNDRKIISSMWRLQEELRNFIEASDEYGAYKNKILQKLYKSYLNFKNYMAFDQFIAIVENDNGGGGGCGRGRGGGGGGATKTS